jgi:hypothetical protein
MPALALPFVHLNLRRNPFGELTAAERTSLAVVDAEAHAARLRRPPAAVQVIGRCGAGKTTHLLAIAARLPGARVVRLDRGEPVPDAPALVLDEVQWLPRRERLRLFRRRCAFAIGSHEDVGAELSAEGVPTATIRLDGMSVDRLRVIVERRIEHARRGPGPVPRVPDAALEALVRRHRDDVRAMESELYDAFQSLQRVEETVEVRDGVM